MSANLYVAQDYGDGGYSLLHLEPKTLSEADRAIAWQHRGQDDGFHHWVLLTKDHANQTMLLDGKPVPTVRSPYTEDAWAQFWSREA